ncbi:TonB-dependent receptor [Telluribacter sp. SYSU D00476]|uniref:TonB-dependent receptor n=1 Tax=Telluribacter sp. SYSU D00476 TaxID=2811430 RepID=UPI001FF1B01C|nr:TonB-dependent receptor [Telluribacter sp. SYSU D00476]
MHKKLPSILPAIFLYLCLVTTVSAQTVGRLEGTIQDKESGKAISFATVYVKGSRLGTSAAQDGTFTFRNLRLPCVLQISSVGYESREVEVVSLSPLAIRLTPQTVMMGEVVVTASRMEEKRLESPITVEQLDRRAIQSTPAATFFDALENVKGVQMTTASLGFKVPNTRGFTNPTNVRFLQLVDGVDTQAPVIGASIANAVGPTELDIERVEVIPGTASALYGMNSLNGLVHFFTRSPFRDQGLSVYQRTGVNHIKNSHTREHLLTETALRYARAFQDRFAFKVNMSWLSGYDWLAHQQTDLNPTANATVNLLGADNPALDPVNSYGNESPNRRTLSLNGKNHVVARTGYYEKDITDYTLRNLKGDIALHYKISSEWEAQYSYRIGRLDNVYHRTNRFRLNDYTVQQHGVQLKSNEFTGKVYFTREVSGNSYNIRSLAENLDRHFKSDDRWFGDYRTHYLQKTSEGLPVAESHQLARDFADQGRYQPGTARYDSVMKQIITINNWDRGAALRTRASLFHTEGQYDLSSRVRLFHLLVGYDYRLYSVFPDGNYFINPVEEGKNLLYRKGGAFVQLARKLFQEKLQISAALRYDKGEYFRGIWNPRLSAVYALNEQNYLRASYQNGYRFPSLFEAFSNVNSGGVKRVGGLPIMSQGIFENSYIRSSLDAFQAAVNRDVNQNGTSLNAAIEKNADLIRKSSYDYVKPERINSFEIGYKGLALDNRLYIDADFYFNAYTNFIAQVEVNQLGQAYQTAAADSIPYHLYDRRKQDRYRLWTNSTSTVFNLGSSVGLTYKIYRQYTLNSNLSYARLYRKQYNDGLEESFNTPGWISNLSVGNPQVARNVGFQVVWHWQDAFLWQSSLGTGIVPAYHNLDAQVSLMVPRWRGKVKVGGNNILNRPYYQMIAGPTIGAMYYVTLVVDELF